MAGIQKRPTLRRSGDYWRTVVYKPNGVRSSVSFGRIDERSEKDVRIAFETWLDLFFQMPHKVLRYETAYEAIQQIVSPTTVVTVKELLDRYEMTTQKRVNAVRHGLEHPDMRFIRRLRFFLKPYWEWPVDDFGPDELEEVKMHLLKYKYKRGHKRKHYTRRGINDWLKWVVKLFRWGVGRRIVSEATLISLNEVKPLHMGEHGARDPVKRKRVTEEEFRKVVACCNSVIGDMLTLIWHTGMRPYEICEMRPFDILREDPECWIYVPGRDRSPVGDHKTMRFGKLKVIPLARPCIEILSRRIKDVRSKKYIFSPKDSMAEFLATKHEERKTPLSCGNRPGTNKKEHPMIRPGDHYINGSLADACTRACKRAGIERFVPYDLRRTAATKTRATLGKDAAKTLLGHADESTTEIYLLEEVQEAMKIAKALAALEQ